MIQCNTCTTNCLMYRTKFSIIQSGEFTAYKERMNYERDNCSLHPKLVNRTGKLRKQSYLCNSVIKLNSGRNIELQMNNNYLSLICFETKDFSSLSNMIFRMREVLKKKSLVEMI